MISTIWWLEIEIGETRNCKIHCQKSHHWTHEICTRAFFDFEL